MTTKSFHRGLAGLRFRRLISFLRRNRLYATAHALEQQTGVFFDAAHLRRMLLDDRCAAASSYALRFVTVGDCSPEADELNVRILILRVMADFANGRATSAVEDLFQRVYSSLGAFPGCHGLRKLLLSMRSDRIKASTIYRRIKDEAVKVILQLVAKCPELQDRARLPHCTYDPAYIMSLGPRLLRRPSRYKNKRGSIPANVLVRSFLQRRRPPPVSDKATHSDVPSASGLKVMLVASPRPDKIFPISSATDIELSWSGMKRSRHPGPRYLTNSNPTEEQLTDTVLDNSSNKL